MSPRGPKSAGHRPQRVLALIQGQRAAAKLAGIQEHAGEALRLETIHIDTALPPIIDDGRPYLPQRLEADLVLDFLTHPDLSHDLAALCVAQSIPIVASGKKALHPAVMAPPT